MLTAQTLAATLAVSLAVASPAPDPAAPTDPAQQAGGQQEEQEKQGPPPFPDAIGGFTLGIFGGSVFSGNNTFQVGGTLTYFFKPRARFGIEVEGGSTFGPGGRVLHGNANLVLQTGARTSKIVPYITAGGGWVRAEIDLPAANQAALDRLGIVLDPTTESGPSFNYGGGVRFYLREGVAARADVRDFLVFRDTTGGAGTFNIRRIAGMLSIDF